MRLSITSTTGSPLELIVPRGETVEDLRTRISQKLRVQTDRIVLLHNDRPLTTGKLLDFGVADDSKVTLVPVIEAGLVCSTNRSERSLMDVLESLTEDQITDFLSGHSPLTINVGIGAHTMYLQLQLSAQDVKELQQDAEVRVESSGQHKAGLLMPGSLSHPDSAWSSNNTTGSTTSPTSQTSPPALNTTESTSPVKPSIQRHTTAFNSEHPTSHSSTSVPVVNCHQSSLHKSCALHSIHTSPPLLSTSFLPSCCPHPSCPVQAATPICSPAPSGHSIGPLSPTPASTLTKSKGPASRSTAETYRKPGAVIDSLVNHSPGIFSGTFSGTLAPCSQSSISHPRRGISIILQILSDLLRAASNHQGTPPTLLHCNSPTSSLPVNSVLTAKDTSRESSQLQVRRVTHSTHPHRRIKHCTVS
ncbi:midnolin-like isoform X2 [Channa argus]|uniref:midnolin-like isoform X2 n=1 Tax=Channa argus TaxID=215402 RepID=UPI003521AC33